MNVLLKSPFLIFVFVWTFANVLAQESIDLPALMKQFQSEVAAGETEKAVGSIEKIITRGEALMGKNNPDIIRLYGQKAVMLRNLSRYDEAEKEVTNMRRKAQRALGSDSPVYGLSLNILGSIRRMNNRFADAEEYYRQAIAILEKAGTSGEKDLAETYVNLNDVLSETNQLAEAKLYGKKAFQLTRRIFGPQSDRTITALNNLGMTLKALGELDAAEKRLSESLALHRKVFGADHPETATAENNMGLLYVSRGRYEEARRAYEAAMKIARTKLPASSQLNFSIRNNYGQLLLEQGDHAAAEPLLQAALKFADENLGEDHPLTGLAKHNMGCLMMETKRFDQARRLLRSSAKTVAAKHGRPHPQTITSNAYLAMLSAIEGNDDASIKYFDIVRRSANDAVWQDLPRLDTGAQQKLMGRTFNWTLFSSLSLAGRAGVDQNVLQNAAQWLANGKGIAETALAAARLKKQQRPDALPWVSLDEVRHAIAANGIFVDIVRQDIINFEGGSYDQQVLDPRYIAWIVPKTGDVSRVDLGDAKQVDEEIEKVRTAIQAAGGGDGTIVDQGEIKATELLNDQMQVLKEALWTRIEQHFSTDVKRIILSPDGALWLVPWGAIPIENSQTTDDGDAVTYLVEKYAVSTTLSGRRLVLDAAAKRIPELKKRSTSAVFSNPDFDQSPTEKQSSYQRLFKRPARPASTSTRSLAFDARRHKAAPLPGTEVESAAIIPRMKQWLNSDRVHSFKGSEALESVVKQLISPKSVVLSTHGFFNSADADSLGVNPLKHCGLLFAGCNDPASVIGGDDGVLTGEEITSIDLRNTELVVLSACETGVGLIEDGNGVAGLRRAFKLAGARSVASTLWQIPDFDTAKLMGDFFDALADGEDYDAALRRAQIKRINRRRKDNGAAHPFFWAGFSISGR